MSLSVHSYGTVYDYSDFELELYLDPDNIYTWLASSHPKRGDIQITLTSPQGTTSTLLPYRLNDFINDEGYSSWPFMSVHHWGENPVGTWSLTVSYRSSSGYVSMSGLKMDLYGTTGTPAAVARIPTHCDVACSGRCSGSGPQNCDVCRQKRVANTLECVSSCPNGTHTYKNYCLRGPAPTTHPNKKSDLGVIIGSVVGAVVLLVVLALAAAVITKSRARSDFRFTALRSDNEPAEV